MDGSSSKIKNQAHEQEVYHSIPDCDLIQMAPDTPLSESELQSVSKIIKHSLKECLGHEIQTLETDHKVHTTQNTRILLEYTRKNEHRATWKAVVEASLKAGHRELAEEITAKSRKCIGQVPYFVMNSDILTLLHPKMLTGPRV